MTKALGWFRLLPQVEKKSKILMRSGNQGPRKIERLVSKWKSVMKGKMQALLNYYKKLKVLLDLTKIKGKLRILVAGFLSAAPLVFCLPAAVESSLFTVTT